MKLRFWGVRGAIPAPGPDTMRYGGNTACVTCESESGHLFILDMGTGMVNLGTSLMSDKGDGPGDFAAGTGRATVLLTHTHWDHIQGFPFFAPIFVPGNQFHVCGHADSPERLEGILDGQMNPNYSPIHTLKNLGANVAFSTAADGPTLEVGGVSVSSIRAAHGNTTVVAFRLDEGPRSVVYATDVGYPEAGPPPALIDFYRGADVLIHDTTYTPEDQASRRARGMSSLSEAARAAVEASAGTLVMFHYDQDYDDDRVDAMLERCRSEVARLGGSCRVVASAEGLELPVGQD